MVTNLNFVNDFKTLETQSMVEKIYPMKKMRVYLCLSIYTQQIQNVLDKLKRKQGNLITKYIVYKHTRDHNLPSQGEGLIKAFTAVGQVPAFSCRHYGHLRRVEVSAVGLLAEAEGKDTARFQQFGGARFDLLVVTHPDWAQAQDGDLPGIPVLQSVKAQHLIEGAIPVGIPALVAVPITIG